MRNLWLVLALAGCTTGIGDTNETEGDADTDADTDSDTDVDADADADADVDNVPPEEEANQSFSGDLSTGEIISLGWASDSAVACFPGNENVNFTGNHVFFEVSKQGYDEIWVEADPESGVDISLYVLEFGGAVQTPPDVSSASRCETSFDQANDHNPGDPEGVYFMGFEDRTMLIGVAGANGETSGAFTVKVWQDYTNGFDTD